MFDLPADVVTVAERRRTVNQELVTTGATVIVENTGFSALIVLPCKLANVVIGKKRKRKEKERE